ncbi:hypothetical protein WA026_005032 [Henosepilachna vigintioctopunctata]|uniref:Uncharacterized protein n=1 Tax=Henosepilachna vigintioctopunctata TaxID=420089 RepID=A0AAW1UMT0_9CUCU
MYAGLTDSNGMDALLVSTIPVHDVTSYKRRARARAQRADVWQIRYRCVRTKDVYIGRKSKHISCERFKPADDNPSVRHAVSFLPIPTRLHVG